MTGFARVQQGQDVRMLEIRGDLDLAVEPLGAERGGEVRTQDLDRDLPLVAQVLREVDSRHAATAEFAFNGVAVSEGGREPGGNLGHGAKIGLRLPIREPSSDAECDR